MRFRFHHNCNRMIYILFLQLYMFSIAAEIGTDVTNSTKKKINIQIQIYT